jgi:CrcB protein
MERSAIDCDDGGIRKPDLDLQGVLKYGAQHVMKLFLIACGGAIGSVLRYLVAVIAHNYMASATARTLGHSFPVGTLAVNVVGCLLIGVFAGLFNRHFLPHDHYRLAITVGILGGFTTFSAFGLDTLTLIQHGHSLLALLNIAANVVGGLLTVWIGFWLATNW